MKNRILNAGTVLASVLALSACSGTWEEDGIKNTRPEATSQTQSQVQAGAAAAPAPRTADQIQLYTGSTAAKPYTTVQDIKVAVNKTTAFNADPTVAQVERRLKASAAELGGDAVVNVSISDVQVRLMSWGGRIGTGTVVKY